MTTTISEQQKDMLDNLYEHFPELGRTLGIDNVQLGTVLTELQDASLAALDDLSSTDEGEGAARIGVEDPDDRFTGEDVEAALGEVPTSAELASTDTDESGASLIGIEDAATLYDAEDVEGALAEVKALADIRVQKRTVTIAHDTAAVQAEADNGDPVAINIGAALPANSRIVGVDMRSLTEFSGGSASAVTLDIGTADDPDALVDGADLFAAAVDGGPATMPPGVRPNKTFASAGAQLIATIAPDVGHSLQGLDAGSVVVDVLFIELA